MAAETTLLKIVPGQVVQETTAIAIPKTETITFTAPVEHNIPVNLPILIKSISVGDHDKNQAGIALERLIIAKKNTREGEESFDEGNLMFNHMAGGGWEVQRSITDVATLSRLGYEIPSVDLGEETSFIFGGTVMHAKRYELSADRLKEIIGAQLGEGAASSLALSTLEHSSMILTEHEGQQVLELDVIFTQRTPTIEYTPVQNALPQYGANVSQSPVAEVVNPNPEPTNISSLTQKNAFMQLAEDDIIDLRGQKKAA
jgi:hypothetical protein